MKGEFVLYKDEAGEFRWRFVSKNGRVIYAATEGYKNKQEAIDSIPLLAGHPYKSWIEL